MHKLSIKNWEIKESDVILWYTKIQHNRLSCRYVSHLKYFCMFISGILLGMLLFKNITQFGESLTWYETIKLLALLLAPCSGYYVTGDSIGA